LGVEGRGVGRQLTPVALVVCAGLADAAGRSDLAFYALLAAVPIVAAAALGAYGDLVLRERPAPPSVTLQALLWGLGLVLVTASAGVRAPAFDSVAPSFGVATLTAFLAVAAIQLTLAVADELNAK
jgi:low temperature requirement protein LtrA